MLFRQLFEQESSTYTYLLAARRGGEALLIDPVREDLEKYLQIVRELDLRLVFAIDTATAARWRLAEGWQSWRLPSCSRALLERSGEPRKMLHAACGARCYQ